MAVHWYLLFSLVDTLPALKDGDSYGFTLRQRDTFGGFLLH
jgi:hypothetical protein